jgi:pyrroline-5-carboxylate reductase
MGGALLEGFAKANHECDITVLEPSVIINKLPEVSYYQSVSELEEGISFKYVVIAVKPQVIEQTMPEYQNVIESDALIMSIAAGKDLAFFEQLFPGHPIIRMMPNLPVTIGEGATVAVPNEQVTQEHQSFSNQLFSSTGKLFWEQDESIMDAVTALSGSGPAYIFHFIECMMDAAEELGLSADLAKNLAYQTALGSVALASQSSYTATQLRKQVTSPKGTTEAALKVFMDSDELKSLCLKAMQAAKDRSKELSS